MGRRIQKGFTVIEVVLVLAISGLIMMGIMSNHSRQVNEQNYRDGVESFRDFLAGQFEDLDAVKNNANNGCTSPAARGAGNCFYTGKYIEIKPVGDQTELNAYPIQSYVLAGTYNSVDESNREDTISRVEVKRDDINKKETYVDWGVQVRAPGNLSNQPAQRVFIIYRNPITGRVSSHMVKDTAVNTSNIKRLAEGTPISNLETSDAVFCLSSPTDSRKERWVSMKIAKGAIDASGITLAGTGGCS